MPNTSPIPARAALLQRGMDCLSRRNAIVGIVALALLLTLPALGVGLHTDDYLHRAVLMGLPSVKPYFPTAVSMFEFVDSNPRRTLRMIDRGSMPWWAVPGIRASFWRPLTVATHWLDYHLWPNRLALMHAQSLLWFAALVAGATCLYRRVMGLTWIAGLAALLYAVDDTHATPAAWLANRNIVVAAFFGVCAMLAHHRWRSRESLGAALLAPSLLAASLLAGEAGLSTCAYLAAYAVFLDRGSWRRRLLTLAPCLCVVIVWRITWTLLGHGAVHVGYYVDPLHEPMRFLTAVVERALLLLLAQWALFPADLAMAIGPAGQRAHWWVAVGFIVLLATLLNPVLRRSATARFWTTGMLLSLLPVCATFPSDRLLFFVGLGAMGLLAEFLASVLAPSSWDVGESSPFPKPRASLAGVLGFPKDPISSNDPSTDRATLVPSLHRLVKPAAVALGVAHLVLSPPALVVRSWSPVGAEWMHPETLLRVSLDAAVEKQDVCIVNSPMPSFGIYFLLSRELAGEPVPRRARVLSAMTGSLMVTRPDAQTLIIRLAGRDGFNLLRGLFRSERDPMKPGERVDLTGLSIEVERVDADGLPVDEMFRFDVPLEDTSLRWLYWKAGRLQPWTPPPVGQAVQLDSASLLADGWHK